MYTSIVGDRDTPRDDIKCFGDTGLFKSPVMEAKRYKILPHLFFKTDTTWVDGNVFYKGGIESDADIVIFKHPYRKTVWEEFDTLKILFPDITRELEEQEAHYRAEGLPDVPLYECNFMIRKNNKQVNKLMEAWWAQICRWQCRDQVSLPYVLWKYPVKVKELEGNIRNHKLFKYDKHQSASPNIYNNNRTVW